eukprot:1151055-Rhodomonas_salina.1
MPYPVLTYATPARCAGTDIGGTEEDGEGRSSSRVSYAMVLWMCYALSRTDVVYGAVPGTEG